MIREELFDPVVVPLFDRFYDGNHAARTIPRTGFSVAFCATFLLPGFSKRITHTLRLTLIRRQSMRPAVTRACRVPQKHFEVPMISIKRARTFGAALVLALGATACAGGPLIVTSASTRGSDIKFGFTQAGTGRQGIIKCSVTAEGNAEQCSEIPVVFE